MPSYLITARKMHGDSSPMPFVIEAEDENSAMKQILERGMQVVKCARNSDAPPDDSSYWPPRRKRGRRIICPNQNCGYEGPSLRHRKGGLFILTLLLFLAVVPAAMTAWSSNDDTEYRWPSKRTAACFVFFLVSISPAVSYFTRLRRSRMSCPKCGVQIANED